MIDVDTTDEGVRLTLLAQSQPDLLRWLLRWGADVRVLEPEWLRVQLVDHAERMLRGYRATRADE